MVLFYNQREKEKKMILLYKLVINEIIIKSIGTINHS